jgi:sugar/nucleoside kinase (ribokinase family)
VASRVVVLGDVMLDVVVRPLGPLAPTSDTPSQIRVTRGGSGASFAVSLRLSGHETCYVGAMGRDPSSELFSRSLADAQVTTALDVVDAPTGTVVSIVSEDGERMMLTDRGANSHLRGAFVEAQLVEPFDHLHVSGYLLLDPATRAVAVQALRHAGERRVPTSVDVCSVSPLRDVTPDVFLRSATYATQLFANEEESLVLTDTEDAEAAADVLTQLFDEVVITRGARGALCAIGAERFHVAAHRVAVLDTTGAGDAATGAYLGARLHGVAPTQALAVAMEAAARVVGGLGAFG